MIVKVGGVLCFGVFCVKRQTTQGGGMFELSPNLAEVKVLYPVLNYY